MLDDLKETGRGLARVDATLKSYLGNPLTGLVYAASLAIGAISILAMYESPLSPLPVPSLPKPPVGRFPPENPVWPPVSKNPVKLKHAAGGIPYAVASSPHAIYSLAPQGSISDHKMVAAASEENSWLSSQNLVSSSYAPVAGSVQQTVPMTPHSRRNDAHVAQLQSYISQMSKIPVIRSKSVSENASVTTAASASNAVSSGSSPVASNESVAASSVHQNHQPVAAAPASSSSSSSSSSVSSHA